MTERRASKLPRGVLPRLGLRLRCTAHPDGRRQVEVVGDLSAGDWRTIDAGLALQTPDLGIRDRLRWATAVFGEWKEPATADLPIMPTATALRRSAHSVALMAKGALKDGIAFVLEREPETLRMRSVIRHVLGGGDKAGIAELEAHGGDEADDGVPVYDPAAKTVAPGGIGERAAHGGPCRGAEGMFHECVEFGRDHLTVRDRHALEKLHTGATALARTFRDRRGPKLDDALVELVAQCVLVIEDCLGPGTATTWWDIKNDMAGGTLDAVVAAFQEFLPDLETVTARALQHRLEHALPVARALLAMRSG